MAACIPAASSAASSLASLPLLWPLLPNVGVWRLRRLASCCGGGIWLAAVRMLRVKRFRRGGNIGGSA